MVKSVLSPGSPEFSPIALKPFAANLHSDIVLRGEELLWVGGSGEKGEGMDWMMSGESLGSRSLFL